MIYKVKPIKTKERRVLRIRGKLSQSALPRVSVFKSGRYLYAQLIDDGTAVTLASVGHKDKGTAHDLGELLAQKALKVKVSKVKFDRGEYRYHGKVKEFAEGLRSGGIEV
jgi:large subunit ribosomal protein L18